MFTEDLSPFFNAAELATTATLDGVVVTGIFDNAYTEAFGMASRQPMFALPTSSAAAATQASLLLVESNLYRVTSVQPDGT
ncbi:MAG: hypothetical protein MUF08_13205, partial [Burkholderiaceae bacterium]|nr:hypothetical protein [Burkholderiaceae bacterium]